MICFIVDDGANRVIPKILQQLKAVAGILSQFFAQLAKTATILGGMTEHTTSLSFGNIWAHGEKDRINSLLARE
jgi:hypothetical protein